MRDQWYCSPQTNVRPVATAARPSFIKTERGGKKSGETSLYTLTILHCFHSPFFQLNCHFWDERERSMVSQPTDQCSPRRHYRPLAFIKTEQGGKKNGETTLYALTILHFIHSTFFQLNRHFWGEHVINGIAAHRPMFAPPPLLPSCVY
jgi:hypothetical protein